MNESTKINDILKNSLFKGIGQFLFPTDFYSITNNMTLKDVDHLLPYHSHIEVSTTIEVLEYLENQRKQGNQVFYDIYTEKEKQADPTKRKTGLFFFKGKKNAPFAIINAGGGFSYVGSIHESMPHSLYLSKQGYNGFALQYRTGGADVACLDLARAIEFIFEHAKELEVDTNCYSLWGGSAGARMAAYLGSYGTISFGGKYLPKPGTVVMQYTGHSDYTRNEPPTFVCVGENDRIASWRVMERRTHILKRKGVDVEFHKYPSLGHGFGLGIHTSAKGWIDDAIHFWQKQIEKGEDEK